MLGTPSSDPIDVVLLRGLRNGAWLACAVFGVATLALLVATGTSLTLPSIGMLAAAVLVGGALYGRYTWWQPDPRLSAIIGGLMILLWAGFAAGTTALAALRTGAPLIDADLARMDAALGVYTPSVIAWLAAHRAHHAMSILAFSYDSTVPLLFAAVMVLGVTRRETAVWELCLTFTATAAICTLLSSIVPAAGTFVQYTIPPDVIADLPKNAGTYHLKIFDAYRAGIVDTIDIRHLEGVVTFPSFHTCMALTLAYALRSIRWLFAPACVWSGVTILSTMPMGGHYFIDLLVGACIWAVCTLPYPRLLTRSWNSNYSIQTVAATASIPSSYTGRP